MHIVDVGIYDVTLTVTDDSGLFDTDTTEPYVTAGSCPELEALLDQKDGAIDGLNDTIASLNQANDICQETLDSQQSTIDSLVEALFKARGRH